MANPTIRVGAVAPEAIAFDVYSGSAIARSTQTSPISITTSSAHGLTNGNSVVVAGHTGNTAANGTWVITVTDATTFTLTGSTGNAIGGATGGAAIVGSYDLSTVTVAVLRVLKPDGTSATWTPATLSSQTATTLRVTHVFLMGEVSQDGAYSIYAKLTVPSGTIRTDPAAVTGLIEFG